MQASLLCKATYEGKLDRLGLLLKAGCNPDAHDYGAALRTAAAEFGVLVLGLGFSGVGFLPFQFASVLRVAAVSLNAWQGCA
jgi:hypothetical protein